jgi:hypothetical protein
MCQAYDGAAEARWYYQHVESEQKRGHPGGCDFQAGYFQCPNRDRRSALNFLCINLKESLNGAERIWGWKCEDCGSFYPELNGH